MKMAGVLSVPALKIPLRPSICSEAASMAGAEGPKEDGGWGSMEEEEKEEEGKEDAVEGRGRIARKDVTPTPPPPLPPPSPPKNTLGGGLEGVVRYGHERVGG